MLSRVVYHLSKPTLSSWFKFHCIIICSDNFYLDKRWCDTSTNFWQVPSGDNLKKVIYKFNEMTVNVILNQWMETS